MLGRHAPSIALMLALVAGMGLAQTGEADPPAAETVLGTGQTSTSPKPKRVLTLQEKEALRIFCTQTANRKDARCEGFAEKTGTVGTGDN
jgi:hypothetical protein